MSIGSSDLFFFFSFNWVLVFNLLLEFEVFLHTLDEPSVRCDLHVSAVSSLSSTLLTVSLLRTNILQFDKLVCILVPL